MSCFDEFEIVDGVLVKYNGNTGFVEIPENVSIISESAFSGHNEILQLIIPSTLMEIEPGAFFSCHRLVEIYNMSELNIVEGYATARYAKIVHKSIEEESVIRFDDEYAFAKIGNDCWMIAYYGDAKILDLPECFFIDENKVEDYIIAPYAFEGSNIISLKASSGAFTTGSSFLGCRYLIELYDAYDRFSTNDALVYHDSNDEPSVIYKVDDYYYYYVDDNVSPEIYINDKVLRGIGVLVGYFGQDKNLSIPETIKVGTTTIDKFHIREYAFSKSIAEKIVLANSIISLSQDLVCDLKTLKKLVLNDSLEAILSFNSIMLDGCPNFEFNEFKNCQYLGSTTNDYFYMIDCLETSRKDTPLIIHQDTKIVSFDTLVEKSHFNKDIIFLGTIEEWMKINCDNFGFSRTIEIKCSDGVFLMEGNDRRLFMTKYNYISKEKGSVLSSGVVVKQANDIDEAKTEVYSELTRNPRVQGIEEHDIEISFEWWRKIA